MSHRRDVRPRAAPAILLAGMLVLLLATPGSSAPWTNARAWIDAPLTGGVVPLGPVVVTAHATDPSGIAEIELHAGGVIVDSATPADPQATLAVVELGWTPITPGGHWLTVRARAGTGDWGTPDLVLVVVSDAAAATPSPRPSGSASPGASASPTPNLTTAPTVSPRPSQPASTTKPTAAPTPTPTPTPNPTPTPTPTSTPRPTPVPCTPPAPDLLGPSGPISDYTPTLRWEYRTAPSCVPSGFRVQIATDRSFNNVIDQADVGATARDYTPSRLLADCTTYSWRVFGLRSDGALGPASGVLSFTLQVGRC